MLNTSPGVFFNPATRARLTTAATDCAREVVSTWLADTCGDAGDPAARVELELRIARGILAAVQGVYQGLSDGAVSQ